MDCRHPRPVKIALVTPEFLTLVRRTNLAHVAESLALSLKDAGADIRVFLPRTIDLSATPPPMQPRAVVRVPDGDRKAEFQIYEQTVQNVPVYLFDHPTLFAERHPYGGDEGLYEDNWKRYSLFARAVLQSIEVLGFDADIFHCLDWTTGLIPVYHELEYVRKNADHPATKAGTYFAIHNLAVQGAFEREILPHIGIPHEQFKQIDGVELGGKVNFLKSGAEFATVLGTHSPSHALKIQEKDRGYGMEETFQRRKKELVGITNGIDYLAWDPNQDPLLPAAFSADDKDLAGKRKCKAALQSSLQLDSGPRTPVACMVGRWDADSGFDLVAEIFTQVLERNVELVIMGSGSEEIGQRLRTIEGSFIGRCRVIDGIQPSTAHLIMGGSDLLLLPSHYQPSNPLFAIGMRYGVVPVVYGMSGLEDTVIDFAKDPKEATGFHFPSYTADALLDTLVEALKVYRDAASWKTIVHRCLQQDFSWSQTASDYLKAYRRVTRRTRSKKKSA